MYENNNDYVHADNLFDLTNDKFNTSIDKDFFDNLLLKSTSFELLNTNDSPLVKLTKEKYNEIDKNVSEYSIEPHIERFLDQKGFGLKNKEKILEILFQSIYENIYTFKPDKIKTIIPQHISNKLSQEDLDIFNQFL